MAIGHAMIKSNHVDVIAYHCRGLHRAWSMNKHGFVISLQKKKFEANEERENRRKKNKKKVMENSREDVDEVGYGGGLSCLLFSLRPKLDGLI